MSTTPEFSVIVGENTEGGNQKENEERDSQVIEGHFQNIKNEDSEK